MAVYIEDLVKDLYENVNKQIALGNKMQDFRRGTLVIKKRREESYYYLSYRDGKKVITDYLGKLSKQNIKKINDEINEGIKIKNELKKLQEEEIKIRKLIKAIDKKYLQKDVYEIMDIIVIIRPILKAFGLKKVYLYGDYAIDEQDEESEIRLICDKPKKPIKDLANKLKKELDKEIVILISDSRRDEEYIEELDEEKIFIYGGY